jgi:hypothetical protein
MRDWIGRVLAKKPVTLTFASRDSTLPEGKGGKYFLIFDAAANGDFEDLGALALIVYPGQPEPIDIFSFAHAGQKSGVGWVAYFADETGHDNGWLSQSLITPKSVKDWPGSLTETEIPIVRLPDQEPPQLTNGRPAGTYALGTKTGITAVDHFLDVVYAGDLTRLANDAEFWDMPCSGGLEFPNCKLGELEWTPHSVVLVATCMVNFVESRQDLQDLLSEIQQEGTEYLYAVVSPSVYLAPYAVYMKTASYPGRVFLIDDQGRLKGFDSCPYQFTPPEVPRNLVLPDSQVVFGPSP